MYINCKESIRFFTEAISATVFLLILTISGFLGICLTLIITPSLAQEDNSTLASPSLPRIEFSPYPIWEEVAINTGVTRINETHQIVTFDGNGTITIPDTKKIMNMTNHGTAIISPIVGSPGTFSASGRESVLSEGGDTATITFNEIVQYDPTTLVGEGIVTAVFDRNATGILAPLSDMIVVGIHEENPDTKEAVITLWEW